MLDRTIPITGHCGQPRTLWSEAIVPSTDPNSQADARHARRIVWKTIDIGFRYLIIGTLFGAGFLAVFCLIDKLFLRSKGSF